MILMYRENSEIHAGEGKKSLRRATAIIGMNPDLDPTLYDHREEERYGIGKGTVCRIHIVYLVVMA